MCELGEQLEQEKARCEGVVRQDRQEVTQFFQTLEVVLAKKRQSYLDALDKAGADVSRVYDPLIHRVKELQVCKYRRSQEMCSLQRCSRTDAAVHHLDRRAVFTCFLLVTC